MACLEIGTASCLGSGLDAGERMAARTSGARGARRSGERKNTGESSQEKSLHTSRQTLMLTHHGTRTARFFPVERGRWQQMSPAKSTAASLLTRDPPAATCSLPSICGCSVNLETLTEQEAGFRRQSQNSERRNLGGTETGRNPSGRKDCGTPTNRVLPSLLQPENFLNFPGRLVSTQCSQIHRTTADRRE